MEVFAVGLAEMRVAARSAALLTFALLAIQLAMPPLATRQSLSVPCSSSQVKVQPLP